MTESTGRREVRLLDFLREWRMPELATRSNTALVPIHLERAAREVARRLGDLAPRVPAGYELERVAEALRGAWAAEGSLASVAPRNLRLAPWVLFFPRQQPERWLASDSALAAAWLSWLRESGRTRAVVTLLREFISAYPADLPAFERIREALGECVATGRGPRIERWRARSARFGFLEREAPTLLTRHWWDVDATFAEYAQLAGLAPGLERSALVARATGTVLRSIEQALDQRDPALPWLSRALEWVEQVFALRFVDLRGAAASALLSPFRARATESRVQELLEGFLLRAIGDPRSQRARWQGIPDEIRNVLLRWLVKGSLEDFFRVLDETAKDAHWRYRKDFWSAYLEHIRDAWIVLGPAAVRIVRREFESTAGAGKLRMGGGTQSSHSVLLMRIGTRVIAEWSHDGRCWIWSEAEKGAPSLYATEYARSELRHQNPACGVRHIGSEDGHWQDEIARRIADATGIRVSRNHYIRRSR